MKEKGVRSTMSGRGFSLRRIALGITLFGAAAGTAAAQLTVTGVVRAEDDVVLNSEFAGIVERIVVTEGQQVTEGDLLVELKNDREQISVELARAGAEQAAALVEETEVQLANARKELQRVQIAAASLPRKELEDAEDLVLRLEASLSAQQAEKAQAEQEVLLREQELSDTRLIAPFTGTVAEILVDRGDTLRPMETPVLALVDLERLYAELLLPTRYVPRVRTDQTLSVAVESEWMGAAGRLQGRVSYVNPTVDAASRTFKIKVEIPSANGRVRPGMLAEVRFP